MAISKSIPNNLYAQMRHFEETGRLLRLNPPITFNEKIWWLKLNNFNPLLTICSDKVAVRDFVSDRGYAETLIPLLGVYDSPADIDFEKLPEKAYIKLSSASGINAAWNAHDPFDRSSFIKYFSDALRRNYFHASREWNYKDIPPKLVVEEHLDDDNLVDYRFLCFHGEVKLIFV